MKPKPMKLWAVCIGKKERLRYVAYNNYPQLAVYENRSTARKERKEVLKTCGHKNVYVVPFEVKE
ncbi:MAG: hypothetical protein NT145_00330 [Elusimicrobia bacterium]|nr:hypothetical protein [Elusimicrobiota bacterium]